jgi:hypothetical protein
MQVCESICRPHYFSADGLVDDGKAVSGLYVGQFYPTSIGEYGVPDAKNNGPKCLVSSVSGTNGFGVNAHHDLYDPDAGSGQLIVFGPKCGAALSKVAIPSGNSNQATDAAFNENSKAAYVDTIGDGVLPIKYGAASFGTALTCAMVVQSFGVAVDGKGNVFQSGRTSSNANVIVEWKAGAGSCKTLGVTGLGYVTGIAFDSKYNLIVMDLDNGILIFKPPYSGAPTRTITPKGGPLYGKLDALDVNLYVSDLTNGSADVFTYATGAYKYSITNGLIAGNSVDGIGIDPP